MTRGLGRSLLAAAVATAGLAFVDSGAASGAESEPIGITLSYRVRCSAPGATLRPPSAHLEVVSGPGTGAPGSDRELTWAYRVDRADGTAGQWQDYASVVTDSLGNATPQLSDAAITGPIVWWVHYAGDESLGPRSVGATQGRLGIDTVRQLSNAISAHAETVYYGQGQVSGHVTKTVPGEGDACPTAPAVGAIVDLEYQDVGQGWQPLGSATVDGEGRWSMPFMPAAAGQYGVRAVVRAIDNNAESAPDSTRIGLRPSRSSVAPASAPRGYYLPNGAGHPRTMTYTLNIETAALGGWGSGEPRTASLWFFNSYTGSHSKVANLTSALSARGKAVFRYRDRITRNGTYVLKYAGTPKDGAAVGRIAVAVRPVISGWPHKRKKAHKRSRITRTVKINGWVGRGQRAMLLERRPSWGHYRRVKFLKPNAHGKVSVTLPSGWKGRRHYRVWVGGYRAHGGSVGIQNWKQTKTWTVTRR